MRNLSLIPMQCIRFIFFALFYSKEFIKSNLILMVDVIRPKSRFNPAIVKLDLISKSDREIALIAILISLTPGTLTLSIKADPPAIFVYGMFVDDVEMFRRSLELLEIRLFKAIRFPHNAPIEVGQK